MDRSSSATETTPVSATTEPCDRQLCIALERYVDEIVSHEVATAQATWAAHSTMTDEEAAVLRELAEAIAADVVTERVRMAVREELDGRSTASTDERCERIATLFDLPLAEPYGDPPSSE
ncbi:hypothetical protein [Halorubrum vacuolatum]|uniref:Uncharacterized protein n=1 Tax=Halorubrum vacuolatum TaxID=63740 RepID=A0A238WIC0_HALVU|nr:hypothetical protein [Halorubrum vacuolatum]SNR45994.1 hypothetical protein SAMN06264855_1087 [Halorubrum vacuolatum]